jgi:hypothetical protein
MRTVASQLNNTGTEAAARAEDAASYAQRCVQQQREVIAITRRIVDEPRRTKLIQVFKSGPYYADFPRSRLSVGDIGQPSSFRISQIAGEGALLGELTWRTYLGGEIQEHSETVWVSGIKTDTRLLYRTRTRISGKCWPIALKSLAGIRSSSH